MGGKGQRATLAEAADLLTGFPFKSADFTDVTGDIRLVRGDNVVQGTLRWDGVKRWPSSKLDGHRDYLLRPGDVVLAMDRPWIEAGLKHATLTEADCPSLLVQRVARLRARAGVNQRFLGYVIRSADFTSYILGVQTGTAVPHISGPQIKAYEFFLPPLKQQERVAELLGALDDKIELNRRMAETLEAMARALFKSWFVDFDPVRAKAEGCSTGLPEELAALFPDSFGEDGLPRGWERRALNPTLVRSIVRGISPAYAEDGVLVINQKCVRGGRVDLAKARRSDPARKHVSEDRLLALGDIVINSTGVGTLGRVAQIRHTPELLTADSHVTIVKLNESEISANLFGLALLESEPLIETLGRGSTGQTELSRDSVGELEVTIAPSRLRRIFDDVVVPLRERADCALEDARTLADLRDTLLPKLISGELRIADAEERIAAA